MIAKSHATWAAVVLFSAGGFIRATEPPLDFSRDIRPILSENCFHCHGPDAARYADSHGFNNDGFRTMWRWRDWVIEAFNADLPYDRFITEQLAGDLLPRPTLECARCHDHNFAAALRTFAAFA